MRACSPRNLNSPRGFSEPSGLDTHRARHTRCNNLRAFSCDYHGIWSSPWRWTSPRSARRKRRADNRCRTRPADIPYVPCDTDGWCTSVGRGRPRDRSADRGSRSRTMNRKHWSDYWRHPRTWAGGSRGCARACRASPRCCKCSRRRPRTAVGARDLWKTLGQRNGVAISLFRNHSRRGRI